VSPKQVELLGILDTFGHHAHAARVSQRDDGDRQRQILVVDQQIGNEAAVDLESIDRHAPKMAQPGESGSEIVQPDLDAPLPKHRQNLSRLVLIGQHRRFGQFQMQAPRLESGLRQRSLNLPDQ